MNFTERTHKNFIFFLFLLMINDFISQNSKLVFVKGAKSFLDDYQGYQLQLDGNLIEGNNDYKPLDLLNEDKEVYDKTIDSDFENVIQENPKKYLSKNVKKNGDDIENIEELLGSENKITLRKKLKKMMKLLNSFDDNDMEDENDGNSEENNKKNFEEIIKVPKNEDVLDKSANIEDIVIDKNENEELKANDDFSILDSPTNMENTSKDKNNFREFKNENNKESIAKNRKGEWDKIKILDTSNWPELCRLNI